MSVRHFTDYRSYLIAHAQERKQIDPKWTLGRWAQQLKLRSTSSITKVISGERLPGPQITESLVGYFKFSPSEAAYFKDLISFHKVKGDPRLAVAILERMGKEHPTGSVKLLEPDSFVVISNWYALAVREFVRTSEFVNNPKWISQNFEFEVTPTEISKALESLKNTGLIRLNSKNQYEVTAERVHTDNDVSREGIRRYHEQTMSLAQKAVRKFTVEEREFQASTLILDSGNLKQAKELIREFRAKFCKLMEETSGDRIYQFQMQLYPLTKKSEPKGRRV